MLKTIFDGKQIIIRLLRDYVSFVHKNVICHFFGSLFYADHSISVFDSTTGN